MGHRRRRRQSSQANRRYCGLYGCCWSCLALLFSDRPLIKLTDNGPVFYVTNRVGKWGKEFRFPKFRSMRVGAELMQAQMQVFNLHKGAKKFKIKRDPTRNLGWLYSSQNQPR